MIKFVLAVSNSVYKQEEYLSKISPRSHCRWSMASVLKSLSSYCWRHIFLIGALARGSCLALSMLSSIKTSRHCLPGSSIEHSKHSTHLPLTPRRQHWAASIPCAVARNLTSIALAPLACPCIRCLTSALFVGNSVPCSLSAGLAFHARSRDAEAAEQG